MRLPKVSLFLSRLRRSISPFHLPLEIRVFRLTTLAASITTIFIIFPLNFLQNIIWQHNFFVFLFGLTALLMFLISCKWNVTLTASILVAALLIFPLLWVTNGGARGGLVFYYPVALIYAFILLRGWKRVAFMISYFLEIGLLVFLEKTLIGFVVPFPTEQDQLFDWLTGIVVGSLLIAFLLWAVMSNFDLERRKVQRKSRALKSLVKELQEISIRDGLTGLYNHKYIYKRLEEESSRSQRFRLPLSVILFDVDFFKTINDTLGHLQGDKVLAGIAAQLKSITRSHDVVGRYGGEEFLIILVNTPLEGAVRVAEKVRNAIQEADFLTGGLKVTISAGVAEFHGEELTDLVEQADKCLYRAKKTGRNKVVSNLYVG